MLPLRPSMNPRSLPRVGAIAVLTAIPIAACGPASLGVSPEMVLEAVIASIPESIPTDGGARGSPGRGRIPDSPPASEQAARLLRTANAYVGVRYVWGGNTPRQGFDCSGFTRYLFDKYGIGLPRTSREQSRTGAPVAPDFRALRPGDLMFFAEPGHSISHVAIYAGHGRIIHSSTTNGGVGYTDLNDGGDWFVQYFVAARRVL
jgi:cell wall-associated NlpC family hydrolase